MSETSDNSQARGRCAPALGSEPLPCPFCGSHSVEVMLYNQPTVVCRDCLSGGPAARRLRAHEDNRVAARLEAVELWNRRITPNEKGQR